MYVPASFRLTSEQLASAVSQGGFAHLITPTEDGLMMTPLPLLYHAGRHSLTGHVARANPHWQVRALGESAAVFRGPDAYISPSAYPSKAETGKVVPTWNYEVLHAHGTLQVHDDPDWLLDLVTRLTDHHERRQALPWQVSDAPASFIAGQLRAIVGIELRISRLEAKAKMSQNQPEPNRQGVISALSSSPSPRDQQVARHMQHRPRPPHPAADRL